MPAAGAARARPAAEHAAEKRLRPASMEQIQRGRLVIAMAQAACDHGAGNVTVADVVARAGVSRRTFYAVFANCDECLLAAIEDALTHARACAMRARASRQQGWSAQVREALAGLLSLFEEQPKIARLLVIEWPTAGPAALELRRQVLGEIEQALDAGRQEAQLGAEPPWFAARAAVGAALSVLHSHMLESEPWRPLELLAPLTSMITLPYLGTAAANRELQRPLPRLARRNERSHAADAPLSQLSMRLTYRTLMVLRAIAAEPGASNRAVARAAGIQDQGQASKMLARLQRLGLVENSRRSGARGEPNAWTLTGEGVRLDRAIASQRSA